MLKLCRPGVFHRICIALLGVATGIGLASSVDESARATHSEAYVFPGAPFTGYWNRWNLAPPYSTDPLNPSHHTLWGGNWATDFYQVQFTQGILYLASNPGTGTPQATMFRRTNSCLNPDEYAGEAYEFNLSNAYGTRGEIAYAHVSNWDPVNYQEYPIINGQVLGNGALVGWVGFGAWAMEWATVTK